MIPINDVLFYRVFHIGLKKIQVLRDRGGEFCFKLKTSYCSVTRSIALTKFLLPCTHWRAMKSLEKSPSNSFFHMAGIHVEAQLLPY